MAQDEDVVISPTDWVAEQAKTYEESNGARGAVLHGAPCLLPVEKARVWPGLVELFPPYEGYQKKTDRDIPVIRLRRVAD